MRSKRSIIRVGHENQERGSRMIVAAVSVTIFAIASSAFVEEIREIAYEVTDTYFRIFRCITYVTDGDHGELSWQQPVVIINIESGNQSRNIGFGYEEGCSGFVVRVPASKRMKLIGELIKVYKSIGTARYNDKRYLFLPVSRDDGDSNFLNSRAMYYMPNAVFISPTESSYKALIHNFFNGQKYDVMGEKQEVIDEYITGSGFVRHANLYPDKIKNLNGKEVRFSLLQYGPFTLVLNESNRIIYDGLETRIAAQFVKSSNGTWIGRDNPVYLWGEIFPNGTGTGLFGSVADNTVDMGFSAVYQWFCNIMECSYPYIFARVTCLAPKPEMISGWMTIVMPFRSETWVVFIAAFVLVSLFVFCLNYTWNRINEIESSFGKLLWESFFFTFRLQLEQIPLIAHKKTPMAYFFKMWTVYCFFVACCWQGGIASFLTVPRYGKPINTAADLVERYPSVQWGANHIAWTKSIANASDPILQEIVKNFVVLDDATLKRRVPNKDFAYFVERLPNGHYGLNDYIDREGMKYMRLMEGNIYSAYCVIMLTKGSPYQERLNHIILRMFDTGIILKMEVQVALERSDNMLQNLVRASTEKPSDTAKKLQLSHVQGAIFIYLFGMGAAICTFIVERTSKRILRPTEILEATSKKK